MVYSKLKSYIGSIEHKSIVTGISLLLFLSPILYFSALNNPSHVPRIAFLSLVSVFICFIYFLLLFKNNSFLYFHKIHLLVLALLIWATLSIVWTIDFGNFAYEIIPLWALVGLFFVASQVSSFKYIKIFIAVSVIGALYAALIGLMQNYGMNPVGYRYDNSIMNSTFGYKNHAALYMDLIIPVALVMVIITENKIARWLLAVITAIITGFLLELHTRGSWLVLFIWFTIFLIYLYFNSKKPDSLLPLLRSRSKEIFFIIVATGLIFSSNGLIDKKWQRPIKEGQLIDNSSGNRLRFYVNSLNLIKDKPITGVGYGAFWKGFRKYTNKPLIIKRSSSTLYVYRLHNDPLQYVVELGIFGGLIILSIFFILTYMSYKLITAYNDPVKRLIVIGLYAGVFACGLHSLIDFPLHKPSSAIQFWLYMGLLTGLYIKIYLIRIKPNKIYIILTIIATLLYTTTASAFHYKHIKSNFYQRLAVIDKLNGNCAGATKNIDLAIQSAGFYPITHAVRVYMHTECKTRNDKLIKILNEELTWDDTNLLALLYRGQILLISGYNLSAFNDFNKVVQILPHRPTGKIWLAKSLIALNKKQIAKQFLLKTLKEHPDNKEVNELLSTL